MSNALNTAMLFLVSIIFHFYLLIVMLRLLLQYFGARWHNPVSQFVMTLTQPLVRPLQKIFPGFKGVDLSIIVLLLIAASLKNFLVALLQFHAVPNVAGLLVWSLATCCNLLLDIYFWAVLIRVILSWVNPMSAMAFQEILFVLTEPIMRPAQRIIPTVGGLDFSPIVLVIMIQLLEILVVGPLLQLGINLAL